MNYRRRETSTRNHGTFAARALRAHEQNTEAKFVVDKLAKSLKLEYKDILAKNETEDLFIPEYNFFDEFTH